MIHALHLHAISDKSRLNAQQALRELREQNQDAQEARRALEARHATDRWNEQENHSPMA